jgi:hypothetical protein
MPGPVECLPLRALQNVARVMPEDPLQLLDREPANEASARVLLGSLEERQAQALVQRRTCSVQGSWNQSISAVHEGMVKTKPCATSV